MLERSFFGHLEQCHGGLIGFVPEQVEVFNGAMFFYLLLIYAPQAARRLEKGVWKPSKVRTFLYRWIGIQMSLSIYSTMCAIAIFRQLSAAP